jgi:type IV pilus assembly protein PilE
MKKKNGFSFIELMVVVVIIGILSSIALPSYRDYVLRSQMTEGISSLGSMRVKMEQFFQDNRTYDGACVAGTIAAKPTNLNYFTINCSNLTDETYLITATGLGFTFTLDETNQRSTSTAPDGWTTNDTCWVTNKSGTCQ